MMIFRNLSIPSSTLLLAFLAGCVGSPDASGDSGATDSGRTDSDGAIDDAATNAGDTGTPDSGPPGMSDSGVPGLLDSGAPDSSAPPDSGPVTATWLAGTDFSDVVLGAPYAASAATWMQNFEPPFIVNGSRALFQLLVPSSYDVDTCLQNTIVDGVLRRQKHRSCGPFPQDVFYFDPISGVDTLYIRYRINFDNFPSANGWRTVTAFKGECKRLEFYVYTDGSGTPYWYAQFDNEANCGLTYNRWWSGENRTRPLETGRWYTIEIRWAPGQVWWAVDGETIVEGSGFPSASPSRLMPTMLYGNYNASDWVDDLVIYDDWPCGPRTSCVAR